MPLTHHRHEPNGVHNRLWDRASVGPLLSFRRTEWKCQVDLPTSDRAKSRSFLPPLLLLFSRERPRPEKNRSALFPPNKIDLQRKETKPPRPNICRRSQSDGYRQVVCTQNGTNKIDQAFRDLVSSGVIADWNSRLCFNVRDEVVGHEKHEDEPFEEVGFTVAFTSLGEEKLGCSNHSEYPGPQRKFCRPCRSGLDDHIVNMKVLNQAINSSIGRSSLTRWTGRPSGVM